MTAATSCNVLREALLKGKALKALEICWLTRAADEKLAALSKQNKGGTFHMSAKGHELVGAVASLGLRPGEDWSLPYYRDQAFPLGLGCDLTEIIATFLGRESARQSSGRMMPYHYSHKELRVLCQSSPVGSQFLQAVGRAYGIKQKNTSEVVYVSAGEGATSQGDFHEALNFSSIHQLPVIFMIQDNGWAISVPSREQTAGESILSVAGAYRGMHAEEVDGTDFLALTDSYDRAVIRARDGKGPTVVIAKIPRLGAHSNSDDPSKYRSEDSLEADKKRDPLIIFENFLIKKGWVTAETVADIKQKVSHIVEAAVASAEALPFPSEESVVRHVFPPVENTAVVPFRTTGREVVMMDAIHNALREEMERDENIFVFGQDVADGKGGVFGVTRGLTERFGVSRCFNTPLAESTIIGMALGLSASGDQKAIAEIQFSDYVWTGMNQLVNEIAGFHWRSAGEWAAPLVIRIPYGGYIQGGPYHSQSIEAYLCHTPGLKVVIPGNAADAKALLKAAVRDPGPVIFLEHKLLYRQRVFAARPEPAEDVLLPLGKAAVVREGADVTVVSWAYTLLMAHEVIERLQKEGYSIELIDLRTLVPFDKETVLQSVRKTGKLLIVHEAVKNVGFAAEIAAMVNEEAFRYLDAPIRRVCALDTPVGYSKTLENATLPQKEDIEKAIRELADY